MSDTLARKSVFIKVLVSLLVFLLALILLTWLLLPWWLARWVPQQLESRFDWQTEVGDIRIRPLSATLILEELVARDAQGERVLSWELLTTRLSVTSLLNGQLQPVSLTVEAPFLHLSPGPGADASGFDPMRYSAEGGFADGALLNRLGDDIRLVEGELLLSLKTGGDERVRQQRLSVHSLLLGDPVDVAEGRKLDLQASSGGQTLEVSGLVTAEAGGRFQGTLTARQFSLETLALGMGAEPGSDRLTGEGDFSTEIEWQRDRGLVSRNGTLSVKNLALARPGEEEAWFRVAGLNMDGLAVMAAERELVVSSLSLDRPELTLERASDDLPGWPLWLSGQPWTRGDWHWVLGEMLVTEGRLHWQDTTRENPVTMAVEGLELTLGAMTERLEEPVSWQLRGAFSSGGTLAARGQYTFRPGTLSASFDLDQWVIQDVAGYLDLPASTELKNGLLSLAGQLDLDGQSDLLTGTFEGQASLSHLDIRKAGADEPMLGWRELRLESIEYNLWPARLELGAVSLSEPSLQAELDRSGQFNLAPLLSSLPFLSGEKPGLIFRMRNLDVQGGEIRYRDEHFTPPFRSRVHGLDGSLSRLSNVAPVRGRLALQGGMNEASYFEMAGAIGTMKQSDREESGEEPVVPDMVLDLEYRLSGLPARNRFRSGIDRLLGQLPGEAEAGLPEPVYLKGSPAGGGRPAEGRFRLDLH